MKRVSIIALALALLLSGCAGDAAQDQGGFAPPEDKRLVIYTSHRAEVYEPIVKEFEQRTGVWVEVKTGDAAVLLDAIAAHANICNYLDMPLQHASARVLRDMNRTGSLEDNLALVRRIRQRVPGITLRTTVMVGFPGETEEEFQELLDMLEEAEFDYVGAFAFSPEEGTKAATMEHVPMEEAQRRTELLVDVQSVIIDEYNESVLGDVREVLCEGWSEEAQSFVGRSYAESVDIDGKIYFSAERDIMAGEFVNVRLTGTMDGELTGEAVE